MTAVLAIWLAEPVGAQPPPGPGPFVAGALLGLGAGALVGAVAPPPPPPVVYVAPPYLTLTTRRRGGRIIPDIITAILATEVEMLRTCR